MLTTVYKLLSTVVRSWIVIFIAGIAVFAIIRPALAQIAQQPVTLADYLSGNNVEVGTEEKDGYRQIYYIWDGNKVFITNANYTNSDPVTDGEYIAWMAQINEGWRIFVFNLLSNTAIQLTQSGINVNPRISGNSVVWETQDENGVWQIDLFDGASVRRITGGDMSLNPDIEGDYITYGRKDAADWRGSLYSISQKKEVDITTGERAKSPKLKGGKILLSDGKEEFPLMAGDLFVLDLVPLVATDSAKTVTQQDVLNELEALPPVATGSGNMN